MSGRSKAGKPAKSAAPAGTDLIGMAAMAGEWVEAVEAAAAGLVAAEVAAATAVLTPETDLTAEERAAKERAADAATEEGFDNLPV